MHPIDDSKENFKSCKHRKRKKIIREKKLISESYKDTNEKFPSLILQNISTMDTTEKITSIESVDQKDLGLTASTVTNQKWENVDSSSTRSLKQGELKRTFSVWSILGIGFGLTNSWFGISASLVTGIQS